MSTFSIDLKQVVESGKMDEFQSAMDQLAEAHNEYVEKEAKKLNLSFDEATDVVYLRSRSRWTQEKENKLIALMKEGNRPNLMEWDG